MRSCAATSVRTLQRIARRRGARVRALSTLLAILGLAAGPAVGAEMLRVTAIQSAAFEAVDTLCSGDPSIFGLRCRRVPAPVRAAWLGNRVDCVAVRSDPAFEVITRLQPVSDEQRSIAYRFLRFDQRCLEPVHVAFRIDGRWLPLGRLAATAPGWPALLAIECARSDCRSAALDIEAIRVCAWRGAVDCEDRSRPEFRDSGIRLVHGLR